MGTYFENTDDFDNMVLCNLTSLYFEPNQINIWIKLGAKYLEHKDFEKALVCFWSAISIIQDDSFAWANLGFCYVGLEKIQYAQYCYTQCLTFNPKVGLIWSQNILS